MLFFLACGVGLVFMNCKEGNHPPLKVTDTVIFLYFQGIRSIKSESFILTFWHYFELEVKEGLVTSLKCGFPWFVLIDFTVFDTSQDKDKFKGVKQYGLNLDEVYFFKYMLFYFS